VILQGGAEMPLGILNESGNGPFSADNLLGCKLAFDFFPAVRCKSFRVVPLGYMYERVCLSPVPKCISHSRNPIRPLRN
jgi:hypothetical protein